MQMYIKQVIAPIWGRNGDIMLTIEQIDKIIADSEKRKCEALVQYEKISDKLCDFIVELEKTKAELEKVKVASVKTGYERRYRENFWIVNSDFQAAAVNDTGHQLDNTFFENGNYMSKENAERMAKSTKLIFLLDRFTRENGWTDEAWEDDKTDKCYIYCGAESIEIGFTCKYRETGQVYFPSVEIAQQAIEKYHDLIMEVMQ